MLRFVEFESDGPSLAAITESKDGDFAFGNLQSRGDMLASVIGEPLRTLHLVSQVHGATVLRTSDSQPGLNLLGEADAIATNRPSVALGIRVADCVPVYLYHRNPVCIALIHAGREGTQRGIVRAAAYILHTDFGAVPNEIRALIGPSAGPCCYEVDPDTAKRCSDSGLRVQGRLVDLWSSNRDQLLESGLRMPNIDVTNICTICGNAFHSYRKTATKARNLALLML